MAQDRYAGLSGVSSLSQQERPRELRPGRRQDQALRQMVLPDQALSSVNSETIRTRLVAQMGLQAAREEPLS